MHQTKKSLQIELHPLASRANAVGSQPWNMHVQESITRPSTLDTWTSRLEDDCVSRHVGRASESKYPVNAFANTPAAGSYLQLTTVKVTEGCKLSPRALYLTCDPLAPGQRESPPCGFLRMPMPGSVARGSIPGLGEGLFSIPAHFVSRPGVWGSGVGGET